MRRLIFNATTILVFGIILTISVTFLKTVVFSDFDVIYPEEPIESVITEE